MFICAIGQHQILDERREYAILSNRKERHLRSVRGNERQCARISPVIVIAYLAAINVPAKTITRWCVDDGDVHAIPTGNRSGKGR